MVLTKAERLYYFREKKGVELWVAFLFLIVGGCTDVVSRVAL